MKNTKKQRNVSPEQEEDERGPMPTSAIKDLLKKWEDVRAMVLEWHQLGAPGLSPATRIGFESVTSQIKSREFPLLDDPGSLAIAGSVVPQPFSLVSPKSNPWCQRLPLVSGHFLNRFCNSFPRQATLTPPIISNWPGTLVYTRHPLTMPRLRYCVCTPRKPFGGFINQPVTSSSPKADAPFLTGISWPHGRGNERMEIRQSRCIPSKDRCEENVI
ncbi:hypothetical protein TNCV_731481 [Trichonephila clavipes]|nr:hypothetical protein TNCV_731481 [Trichonephila clavipes]